MHVKKTPQGINNQLLENVWYYISCIFWSKVIGSISRVFWTFSNNLLFKINIVQRSISKCRICRLYYYPPSSIFNYLSNAIKMFKINLLFIISAMNILRQLVITNLYHNIVPACIYNVHNKTILNAIQCIILLYYKLLRDFPVRNNSYVIDYIWIKN